MPFKVTITATNEDAFFPPETVPGGWRFTLNNPAFGGGPLVVISTVPSYQWMDLEAGAYTFTSVRMDANGVTELHTPISVSRSVPDVSIAAKRIVIIGPTRAGNLEYVLWIPVPPSLQADYVEPGAVSAWPDAALSENQAIANGEIFEIRRVIRGGLTTGALEDALEANWARANASVQALVGLTLEDDYWTGTAWVAA